MTNKEIDATMGALKTREREITDKIVLASRTLIPTLKDAGRLHAAATLEELFFEYDMSQEEARQFVNENALAVLMRLGDHLRSQCE